MFNVMLVEDNVNTRKLLKAVLTQNGYNVICAVDGIDALEKLDENYADIIVLDVMMPRMDGYEFTKTLRENGWNIPILMATAKEAFSDKKKGFTLGADDYMVKPIDEEELILRIAALLRRAKISTDRKIVIGSTLIDYDSFTVKHGDSCIRLPQKEFLLLFKLLSYKDKIFTRRQLMDELWNIESDSEERTVDVHINRLRDKFKDNPDFEIVTVRCLGYKAVEKL